MIVCTNGEFLDASAPMIPLDDLSFRYGLGLFETMLVENGRIRLETFHWERLSGGLSLLGIASPFTGESFRKAVMETWQRNGATPAARIRVTVSAEEKEGHWKGRYLVECSELHPSISAFNEQGMKICDFLPARKTADRFANLKSCNALPYRLAARHAREMECDEALLFNQSGSIIESQVANIFLLMPGELVTPPLTEGCVAGVMRRFILERMSGWIEAEGYSLVERPVTVQEVGRAREIFLTNALRPLRWVECYGDKTFNRDFSARLHQALIQGLPG